MRAPLLSVKAVTRDFDVSRPWLDRVFEGEGRRLLHAVDGVTLEVRHGETLALVGESGCGKSTIARLMVGLDAPSGGRIEFRGQRRQMIFQSPYASLNPRWRVRDIVAEPIRVLRLARTAEVDGRVAQLLAQVGLAAEDGERYPHEFSGGQRQRISIARALSGEPDLLVCDEPRTPVAGEVPNPLAPPPGCSFHPRCPHADERCRRERPELIGAVACHAVQEGRISFAR